MKTAIPVWECMTPEEMEHSARLREAQHNAAVSSPHAVLYELERVLLQVAIARDNGAGWALDAHPAISRAAMGIRAATGAEACPPEDLGPDGLPRRIST